MMKVFTSKETGGIMARRLLPWLLLLPVVIGMASIFTGSRSGFFVSEVGVLIVASCLHFLFYFTGLVHCQVSKPD